MANERRNTNQGKAPRRPPATTPEDRERQLQALAYDLAEKQLRDGTISATVLAQLVKSGTQRERLEQERLVREVDLLQRKAEGMESAIRMEEKYDKAIAAMRKYGGHETEESYHD